MSRRNERKSKKVTSILAAPRTLGDIVARMKPAIGLPGNEMASHVSKVFGPHLRAKWDPSDAGCSRILLTPDRQCRDPLLGRCHGLILDGKDMSVISLGAPMLSTAESLKRVTLDDYDVYEAVDGTQVTAYYWGDSWRLSTANGFDVGDYLWLGAKTYWDAFSAALTRSGVTLESLDVTAAYTFVFRDHDFHPLTADAAGIWFVCAHDLVSINNRATSARVINIDMPRQTVDHSPATVGARCAGALTKFLEWRRSGEVGPAPVYYGAVMRSKSGRNVDYFIESTLMKQIRKLMYNLPRTQRVFVADITPANRMAYLVLRAYLSPARSVFQELFPQFLPDMVAHSTTFKNLTALIVSRMSDRAPPSPADKFERLAEQFAVYLREYVHVNAMDPTGPSIIYDFLMQPEHVDVFYATLVYVAPEVAEPAVVEVPPADCAPIEEAILAHVDPAEEK